MLTLIEHLDNTSVVGIEYARTEQRKRGCGFKGEILIFRTINYLESGNEVQRRAFRVIHQLGILEDMSKYNPVLCGTIPIAIDIKGSDLDIILEVYEPDRFSEDVKSRYGQLDGFVLQELTMSDMPTVLTNFHYGGFEFELFAQPRAVEQQNAYLHMLVEHHLLMTNPQIKAEIIRLKEQGMKTEPAFAHVLGVAGDPYDELLVLGTELGVINGVGEL